MASLDLDQLASMNWAEIARVVIENLSDTDWAEFIEEHWDDYFARSEALLTDKQRRFILGLVEYSGENPRQQRYQMRQRIRRRFESGLADLSLLVLLDENSKEDISERLGKESLVTSAADLLQFVYVATGDREDLKEAVSRAVYNAERDESSLGESKADPRDVDVTITVEYQPDYDAIYDKYQKSGIRSLTPREVGHLIKDQRLKLEDIQDYYEGNESVMAFRSSAEENQGFPEEIEPVEGHNIFDGTDSAENTESINNEDEKNT